MAAFSVATGILNAFVSVPKSSRDIVFTAGVIGFCLTNSSVSEDLVWARNQGFLASEEVIDWPGHRDRVAANAAASSLPKKIQERARKLIRRHRLSNAELHAALLYEFEYASSDSEWLQQWKVNLSALGPRSWELRSLFEDVSVHAKSFLLLPDICRSPDSDLAQETEIITTKLRNISAPLFDHICLTRAVFDPFLSPRSGFGLAPKKEDVIVAFGPGLSSDDHKMTIWHELIHYPVRRALKTSGAITKQSYDRRPAFTGRVKQYIFQCDSLDSVLVEENIVAVLTDFLCPRPTQRPKMLFDALIRRHLESSFQEGHPIDIQKLVNAVFTEVLASNPQHRPGLQ